MRRVPVYTTTVMLITSLFVVACSSGSDETPDSSTEVSITGSDVLPLVSSEGAEPGLRGCFNRALYFNGPHFVNTTESQTITFGDISTNSTNTRDLIYSVIDVADDGVTQVDVERTTISSTSSMSTVTEVFVLDGYTLKNLGIDITNPVPLPFTLNFDLDQSETFSFELVTGTDGATSSVEDTYIGREQIEIAGQSVEACKVERRIVQDVGDPSFNTSVASTIWYGVGTGLTLKTDSVVFPFSELDRSTTVTTLGSASINSIQAL